MQTVDKLHLGAQEEVRNGIEVLSKDIRAWDTKLFEADNFELALHKKAHRDKEEYRRKKSLAKALGQQQPISRVQLYKDNMKCLKELCTKHKVNIDIAKMLKKPKTPSEKQLFEMLFELENPYMQIKKNGSLKKAYTHFNLIPKQKSK